MKGLARCMVCFLLMGAGRALAADSPAAPAASPSAAATTQTDLMTLLAEVSRSSDRKFLVADHVPAQITALRVDIDRISYPVLLSILRNNGLAAATVQRVVNIVPVEMVRSLPLPLVTSRDAEIADDEWVMHIFKLKNAEAAHLVPILRPLLPQAGHLAAMPATNTMLIVDRYGDVRKIGALIAEIDSLPQRSPPPAIDK